MEDMLRSPAAESAGRNAPSVVLATGEALLFLPGTRVRIAARSPVGHYRVPIYLRGREAVVEAPIRAVAVNNEEEAFGRNAGQKRHYYRVAVRMTDLWAAYPSASRDTLHIEIFETWLEAIA